MADISAEREGLIDGMPRDARGYWQPEGQKLPNPVFSWPPEPMKVAKWIWNYLFPWHLIYMVLAALTVIYLQPEMSRMTTFKADWIAYIFVRNQIMLIVFVSAWHLWLWARKKQGFQYKYTPDWMAKGKKQFLGGNQLFDNIFWSCVSGGTIWTAYEVVTLWLYANEYILYLDPRAHPVWFALIMLAIICTTATSMSVLGQGCRCTRSSTSSTSAALPSTGSFRRIRFMWCSTCSMQA